jgi:hypothetical protein
MALLPFQPPGSLFLFADNQDMEGTKLCVAMLGSLNDSEGYVDGNSGLSWIMLEMCGDM